MFMKQNDTIFNVLSTTPSYSPTVSGSNVMAWKVSSDLRFYDGLNVLFFIWLFIHHGGDRP